jgi:hypothetical protein
VAIGHCAAVFFPQVPKKYIDLDLSLLYILILETYGKFARKNNFLALSICFPLTGVPRQDHVYITTDESFRFHKNKLDEMPCTLDSTENQRRRSFEKYPTPPWL